MKQVGVPILKNPWLIGLAWVLLFGIGNILLVWFVTVAGPYLVSSEMIAAFWYGAIGAQGALHGIWCVFARCAPLPRIAAAFAVAVFWYGAWVVGISTDSAGAGFFLGTNWSTMRADLLCLPIFGLAIQTPLWAVRLWCRWRFMHPQGACNGTSAQRPGIRHIMVATVAVAGAFACVRWAVPADEGLTDETLRVTITALVVILFSATTTLPSVVATLRSRRWPLSLMVVFLANVAVFAAYIIFGRLAIGDWPPLNYLKISVWMIAGFFVCLNGVLLVARWLGYRLVWGRSGNTPQPDPGISAKEPATTC